MSQDFDDFFLREYDRISEAYFKTVGSISEFMRHYLTIVSLPPAFAVVFARPDELANVIEFFRLHPFVAAAPFFGVAVVGFFLCGYLIALSLNARLYARTVNGIRAHFASKLADDDLVTRGRIVLPTLVTVPSFKHGTIVHVLLAMATVNSAYAAVATFVLKELTGWPLTPAVWIVPAFVFWIHFILKNHLVKNMETIWSPPKKHQ